VTHGALVLAGGGSVGIAGELGYLAGLEKTNPGMMESLRAQDTTYIGTSAGSVVAAMLASGLPVGQLVQPELDSPTQVAPGTKRSFGGIARIAVAMVTSRIGAKSPEDGRKRIGAFAAKAQTGPSGSPASPGGSRSGSGRSAGC
jgi:NTE family protein